jgi:hypothetical protein
MEHTDLFIKPRMHLVVDLDQFFHRNMRVDLRGRQPRVAEQFLYVAQVGVVRQKYLLSRDNSRT